MCKTTFHGKMIFLKVFTILTGCIETIVDFYLMGFFIATSTKENLCDMTVNKNCHKVILPIALIMLIMHLVANVMLLKGTFDRNPNSFKFWLIFTFIVLIFGSFGTLYLFTLAVATRNVTGFLVCFFTEVLSWIIWGVVYRYYKELKKEIKNEEVVEDRPLTAIGIGVTTSLKA